MTRLNENIPKTQLNKKNLRHDQQNFQKMKKGTYQKTQTQNHHFQNRHGINRNKKLS